MFSSRPAAFDPVTSCTAFLLGCCGFTFSSQPKPIERLCRGRTALNRASVIDGRHQASFDPRRNYPEESKPLLGKQLGSLWRHCDVIAKTRALPAPEIQRLTGVFRFPSRESKSCAKKRRVFLAWKKYTNTHFSLPIELAPPTLINLRAEKNSVNDHAEEAPRGGYIGLLNTASRLRSNDPQAPSERPALGIHPATLQFPKKKLGRGQKREDVIKALLHNPNKDMTSEVTREERCSGPIEPWGYVKRERRARCFRDMP